MNFDRKQRFSIRKYSIGVASVLIGSVLAGTTIASADTEVKIDDASKAPVTSTQEAPKVSAVSAQEALRKKHLLILLMRLWYLLKKRKHQR